MCNKLFDSHLKLFYTPIEAALRWCDLLEYEHRILEAKWLYADQLLTLFPQWPCLATHVGLILDAVRHGELRSYQSELLTTIEYRGTPSFRIRHGELKAWMSLYHPDERPPYLFTRSADAEGSVKWGHYLKVKSERDALESLYGQVSESHKNVSLKLAELTAEVDRLYPSASIQSQINPRSEGGLLDVIGALLKLLLSEHPLKKRPAFFASQDAIVTAIQQQYPDHPGFKKRTLDQRFADANKRFKTRA